MMPTALLHQGRERITNQDSMNKALWMITEEGKSFLYLSSHESRVNIFSYIGT